MGIVVRPIRLGTAMSAATMIVAANRFVVTVTAIAMRSTAAQPVNSGLQINVVKPVSAVESLLLGRVVGKYGPATNAVVLKQKHAWPTPDSSQATVTAAHLGRLRGA